MNQCWQKRFAVNKNRGLLLTHGGSDHAAAAFHSACLYRFFGWGIQGGINGPGSPTKQNMRIEDLPHKCMYRPKNEPIPRVDCSARAPEKIALMGRPMPNG